MPSWKGAAASHALAELAKQDVPEEVAKAYGVDHFKFGREYLIPKPFDPRILVWEAGAVAKAAMDTGVAQKPVDIEEYRAELANRIAPEHLELQVQNPFDLLPEIRNAGAVFLGSYTPEPIGDYIAGPNHVLPTAGTARFASALSVDHFVKKTSVLRYSREAFRKEAKDAARLADIEGLGAHARSIRVRLEK